jgi:hypothetical protein
MDTFMNYVIGILGTVGFFWLSGNLQKLVYSQKQLNIMINNRIIDFAIKNPTYNFTGAIEYLNEKQADFIVFCKFSNGNLTMEVLNKKSYLDKMTTIIKLKSDGSIVNHEIQHIYYRSNFFVKDPF